MLLRLPRFSIAAAAFSLLIAPQSLSAQNTEAALSREQTAETVESIARSLTEGYVFEARAKVMAAHLRKRLAAGAYRGLGRAALAQRLQADLRAVDRDRHLEVTTDAPPAAAPTGPAAPANPFAWLERLRNRNYDFNKLERMPGNVGYLELRSFPPPEVAGPTAKAAMTFLANSKAVIIDLRQNGGGTGNMVQLLASYFFVDHVRLLRTFRRANNPQITEDYTLPFLEGQRMPAVDLFVLVSKDTFSAAEAFAFALQQRGRAVVVGETTRGGANPGRYVAAPNGLRVFVPLAHASSPVTEKSWDETGVVPDIAAAPDEAVAVAHREAVKRLMEKSSDEAERKSLAELLETSAAR